MQQLTDHDKALMTGASLYVHPGGGGSARERAAPDGLPAESGRDEASNGDRTIPFVSLKSLRAGPSSERGELARTEWDDNLADPATSPNPRPLAGSGQHEQQRVQASGEASPDAASGEEGSTSGEGWDITLCAGLTPARMNSLDLLRSLDDFNPRHAWGHALLGESPAAVESLDRLSALDTSSSVDLVAFLNSTADEIARRLPDSTTNGQTTGPTMTRAERRRLKEKRATLGVPPGDVLPVEDRRPEWIPPHAATGNSNLEAVQSEAVQSEAVQSEAVQSSGAGRPVGLVPAPAMGPRASGPALRVPARRGRHAQAPVGAQPSGIGPRLGRHTGSEEADAAQPHGKHTAAAAVGAVAASVLGVLTAALVMGGHGTPGLDTAAPLTSGTAAPSAGDTGSAIGDKSQTDAPAASNEGAAAGLFRIPGVGAPLSAFVIPGSSSNAARGTGSGVHGTALGSSGPGETVGGTQGSGAQGGPSAGGSTGGSGSGSSGGSAGSSGGGSSGTSGSTGTQAGSGSGSSGGGSTGSGGSGTKSGSGSGSGSGSSTGSGSKTGSSGSSGGILGVPTPTVPAVTVPTVTVPTVTVPTVTLPPVTVPGATAGSGSSSGSGTSPASPPSVPGGIVGVITGLI